MYTDLNRSSSARNPEQVIFRKEVDLKAKLRQNPFVQRVYRYRSMLILLAIALLLRIVVFLEFPSIYYPDEIFQSQEPAHLLAFGSGVITWEYRLGARSWVLPAVIAGIMKCTAWLSPGSSGYIFGTCLCFSILSLTVVWFAYSWCMRYFGTACALVAAFTTAIWFELIYFGPRTLNEFVAGNLLLPALYFGSPHCLRRPEGSWRLFTTGALLGLTVCLRIQFSVAVLLVGLWVISHNWRKRSLPMVAGIAVVVLVFGLVDTVTWSYPFHSYYEIIRQNIFHHRAAQFGTEPWYFFFSKLLSHTGPMVLLAIVGVRRSPVLGWVCLAVVIPHVLIGHKEYRFIYPVLPIVLILASIGLIDISRFLNHALTLGLSEHVEMAIAGSVILACSLVLASLYPDWTKARGELEAFNRLSVDRDACGVAIRDVARNHVGGYTHLNRSIPIFVFYRLSDAYPFVGTFNRIVAPESIGLSIQGYTALSCKDGTCVYGRVGTCKAGGMEHEINEFMKQRGF